MEVNATVAREMTGSVLPDTFYVFYRRGVQIKREARIYVRTNDGPVEIGTAVLTDWEIDLELASGLTCSPSPAPYQG